MSKTYKILGQVATITDINASVYFCPDNYMAVCSSINVCNTTSSSIAYRIAILKFGDTLSTKSYLVYDKPLAANDNIHLVIGISLQEGDEIIVRASADDVVFNVFGVEISQ